MKKLLFLLFICVACFSCSDEQGLMDIAVQNGECMLVQQNRAANMIDTRNFYFTPVKETFNFSSNVYSFHISLGFASLTKNLDYSIIGLDAGGAQFHLDSGILTSVSGLDMTITSTTAMSGIIVQILGFSTSYGAMSVGY